MASQVYSVIKWVSDVKDVMSTRQKSFVVQEYLINKYTHNAFEQI